MIWNKMTIGILVALFERFVFVSLALRARKNGKWKTLQNTEFSIAFSQHQNVADHCEMAAAVYMQNN